MWYGHKEIIFIKTPSSELFDDKAVDDDTIMLYKFHTTLL